MAHKEPFPMIDTEVLQSALLSLDTENLEQVLAGFDDTVEIIRAHRRDTLRHV